MAEARYKQLVDELAVQIRAGQLKPGTRLPTHRRLAERHGLALVTASRVYAELEAMGLVSGEVGRGTFVRETAMPGGTEADQRALPADMLDLNFNYPALPGRLNCCAARCGSSPPAASWRRCCATRRTVGECTNAPASPGTSSNRAGWPSSLRGCCWSTARSTDSR